MTSAMEVSALGRPSPATAITHVSRANVGRRKDACFGTIQTELDATTTIHVPLMMSATTGCAQCPFQKIVPIWIPSAPSVHVISLQEIALNCHEMKVPIVMMDYNVHWMTNALLESARVTRTSASITIHAPSMCAPRNQVVPYNTRPRLDSVSPGVLKIANVHWDSIALTEHALKHSVYKNSTYA